MKKITRKRLMSWAPALPLLAMTFVPFPEMEIWRRIVVIASLLVSYYVMSWHCWHCQARGEA